MKDLKYYVTGLTAVVLFVYLLSIGQEEMAKELFTYLMFIVAFVFGLQSPTPKVQDDRELIEMEAMKTD